METEQAPYNPLAPKPTAQNLRPADYVFNHLQAMGETSAYLERKVDLVDAFGDIFPVTLDLGAGEQGGYDAEHVRAMKDDFDAGQYGFLENMIGILIKHGTAGAADNEQTTQIMSMLASQISALPAAGDRLEFFKKALQVPMQTQEAMPIVRTAADLLYKSMQPEQLADKESPLHIAPADAEEMTYVLYNSVHNNKSQEGRIYARMIEDMRNEIVLKKMICDGAAVTGGSKLANAYNLEKFAPMSIFTRAPQPQN